MQYLVHEIQRRINFRRSLLDDETFQKLPKISADAFKPVGINVYQLVGFQQRFNLRPDAGEQGVKIIAT